MPSQLSKDLPDSVKAKTPFDINIELQDSKERTISSYTDPVILTISFKDDPDNVILELEKNAEEGKVKFEIADGLDIGIYQLIVSAEKAYDNTAAADLTNGIKIGKITIVGDNGNSIP